MSVAIVGQVVRSVGMLLLLDQLVPHRHAHFAAKALRHLVPVQMPTALLHHPDNMLQLRILLDNVCKRHCAGSGNEDVGSRLVEQADNGLQRLSIRQQNRRKTMKCASFLE
jgi:hypothetical protein